MDGLFTGALREVLNRGIARAAARSESSPNSRGDLIEVAPWVVSTRRVESPFLGNQVRQATAFRGLGMAAWNLLGANDVASLSPYNPVAIEYSDDGSTVRAPWGFRLLDGDAWQEALDLLSRDPTTFRATIPVYQLCDVGRESKDVPCLIAISVVLTQDHVSLTAHMRAMNAYRVFPYDHVLLCLLAQALRAHFELTSASLTYMVASLHIRKVDREAARKALTTPLPARPIAPLILRTSLWEDASAELKVLEPRARALFADYSTQGMDDLKSEIATSKTWAADVVSRLIQEFEIQKLGETT